MMLPSFWMKPSFLPPSTWTISSLQTPSPVFWPLLEPFSIWTPSDGYQLHHTISHRSCVVLSSHTYCTSVTFSKCNLLFPQKNANALYLIILLNKDLLLAPSYFTAQSQISRVLRQDCLLEVTPDHSLYPLPPHPSFHQACELQRINQGSVE